MKKGDPDPLVTIEGLCRQAYFRGVADAIDGPATDWMKHIPVLRASLEKCFAREGPQDGPFSIRPRPPVAS